MNRSRTLPVLFLCALVGLSALAFGVRGCTHKLPAPRTVRQANATTILLEKELRRLNEQGIQAYNKGELTTAKKAWQEGFTDAQKLGDPAKMAAILNNLGSVYGDLSQFEEALNYLNQALTIREKRVGKECRS